MTWISHGLSIVLILCFIPSCFAKDFGVVGEVFEIEEEDMIAYVLSKLSKLKESGRLEEINKGMQNRLKSYANEPKSVVGITKALERRVRTYDPTYELTRDIYDQDGNLMHAKGRKINPLDHMPYQVTLLFIDASDKAQIKWAIENNRKPVKIILVKGKPIELMKKYQTRVYFDQQGILSKKLGIERVPSTVYQKGRVLEILEEVVK